MGCGGSKDDDALTPYSSTAGWSGPFGWQVPPLDPDSGFCLWVAHVNSGAADVLLVTGLDPAASAEELAKKLEAQHGLPARTPGITTRLFEGLQNREFAGLKGKAAESEGPLLAKIGKDVVGWSKDVLSQSYGHASKSLEELRLRSGDLLLYVQVPDGEDGEPAARMRLKDPDGVREAMRVLR